MRVAVALLAALAAASEDAPAFNKEELEKILKAEHSQKVSNVFDAQNNIQCVPTPQILFTKFFSGVPCSPHCAQLWQVHVEYRESGAVPRCRRRVLQG